MFTVRAIDFQMALKIAAEFTSSDDYATVGEFRRRVLAEGSGANFLLKLYQARKGSLAAYGSVSPFNGVNTLRRAQIWQVF